MKTIKDLFNEFMILDYLGHENKIPNHFKDIDLNNYIILRQNESWQILYLTNGNSITFPREFINIFNSLNTYYGDKILYKEPLNINDDKISGLIYNMILLISSINSNKLQNILNTITTICTIGTKELREFFKDNYNKVLDPIRLDTVDKSIII